MAHRHTPYHTGFQSVAWQHAKLDVLVGTILVGGEKINKNDFSLLKQEIRADSRGIPKNTLGYSIRI